MKQTNKLGILAAIGITMSVACIAVRTEAVGATGLSHSSIVSGWSSAHNYWDTSPVLDGEMAQSHKHHYRNKVETCSCADQDDTADEPDVAGDSSAHDTDTTDPSEDTSGFDDQSSCSDSDSNASDGENADSQNSNDSEGSNNNGQPGSTQGDSTNGDNGQDSHNMPVDNETSGDNSGSTGSGSGSSSGGSTSSEGSTPTPAPTPDQNNLELAVDQQVSVAGGDFKPADTEAAAVPAKVGDEVIWKVIVTPVTVPAGENRTVKINWTPPANVEVVSSTPSKGAFDGHVWTVDIADLPAELLVKTTLKTPGTADAVAVIGKISCVANGANAFCDFKDPITTNNSNPSVISTETVAASGSGNSNVSGSGVLGVSTGGRGGEGEMLEKNIVTNSKSGTGTSAVLAATTSNGKGVLANTGTNAFVVVLAGMTLFSSPVALAAVTTKKRS